MEYGIYYAYWGSEWGEDPLRYIKKVKDLGFDILEVACGSFEEKPLSYFEDLRAEADKYDVILTGGYGPIPEHNICSEKKDTVENAFAFYKDIFPKMKVAGIESIGGALYSYWPVDYNKKIDKEADYVRSVTKMKKLADLAAKDNITLLMESLNRFEGYLINTSKEAIDYVKKVNKENVKVLLDTFHMNIEENNMSEAIKEAGSYLGELHIGEANRRPPLEGGLDWEEIGHVLNEIGFSGNVVMEPFVKPGGQIGKDIKIWRNIVNDVSERNLDLMVGKSLQFIKEKFS